MFKFGKQTPTLQCRKYDQIYFSCGGYLLYFRVHKLYSLYNYMELATSDNGPTGFHKEDMHGSFIVLIDFFTH